MKGQARKIDDVVNSLKNRGYNEFKFDNNQWTKENKKLTKNQKKFVKDIGEQLKKIGFK